MKTRLLPFIGAIAGGLAGYFAFFWIARQGFYGLILPGCLLGVGAGLFPTRSITICVACGLSALALGLFTEWKFAPFIQDAGLRYFLLHLNQLKPLTLLMIAAGAFIGFYSPFSRRRNAAAGTVEESARS